MDKTRIPNSNQYDRYRMVNPKEEQQREPYKHFEFVGDAEKALSKEKAKNSILMKSLKTILLVIEEEVQNRGFDQVNPMLILEYKNLYAKLEGIKKL